MRQIHGVCVYVKMRRYEEMCRLFYNILYEELIKTYVLKEREKYVSQDL